MLVDHIRLEILDYKEKNDGTIELQKQKQVEHYIIFIKKDQDKELGE